MRTTTVSIGMFFGDGSCTRVCRFAASATSVSAGSTLARPANPAVSAVRWRNSRRRIPSSGAT